MRPELLALAGLAFVICGADAAAQALDGLGDSLPDGAVQRLGTLRMRYGGVGGLAYLPDGRGVVLTGGYIDIWDLTNGERQSHTKVSGSSLTSVQLGSDGQTLLLGDSAGKVREWDVAKGAELRSLDTGVRALRRARYSPDEKRVLAAGGAPPIIREFDLASGKQLIEIKSGMTTTRCGAIYGPEGSTAILGGGYDHILEHWDLTSGALLQKWYTVYETKDLALSPDGKSVVAGVETHAAEWTLNDYKMLHKYAHAPADGGRVFSVAYLPEANEVLCGGRDGTIHRWSCETGEQVFEWAPHQSAVYHLCASPDEKWALSFGSGRIAETNIATGQPRLEWDRHDGSVEAVAFIPPGAQATAPGQRAISGSSDATLRLWDITSGDTLKVISGATLGAYAVASSPDGERVIAGCKDGVVREFSLGNGELLRELKGHLGYVRALAYGHNSGKLLSSADDGSICVWPQDGVEPVARLEGHRGGVLAVAVSRDDKLALSGGRDGTVRLWDLADNKLLRTLEGHRGWVEAVAFIGDTHTAISAGGDGRILRWDLEAGEQLAEMKGAGWVYALACSPDGARAYSAGSRRVVVCWDLTKNEKISEFKGHQHAVMALAVSQDGKRIVSASRDTTLLVWNAPAS